MAWQTSWHAPGPAGSADLRDCDDRWKWGWASMARTGRARVQACRPRRHRRPDAHRNLNDRGKTNLGVLLARPTALADAAIELSLMYNVARRILEKGSDRHAIDSRLYGPPRWQWRGHRSTVTQLGRQAADALGRPRSHCRAATGWTCGLFLAKSRSAGLVILSPSIIGTRRRIFGEPSIRRSE